MDCLLHTVIYFNHNEGLVVSGEAFTPVTWIVVEFYGLMNEIEH